MKVEINNKILTWARKKVNLSVAEVADRIGKSETTISKWESGEEYPTYSQLEELSYKILNTPIALFFFPSPPEIEDVSVSFRSLPEGLFEELPSGLIKIINKAQVLQLNLKELDEGRNSNYESLINAELTTNPIHDAGIIHNLMSVNVDDQFKIRYISKAFEYWRDKLAEFGIYVFKEAFQNTDFSGFCIYDVEFPIIIINNSTSFSRQIFTLFHELYHILHRTSGIDLLQNSWIDNYTENEILIERDCNTFASEFLVPTEGFQSKIHNKSIDEIFICKLASLYSVSREVIMRRLLKQNLITEDLYNEKRKEYISEALRYQSAKPKGGNYYNTQIAYLGLNYIKLVYNNYNSSRITKNQLSEYLNIKQDYIGSLESKLYDRGL
jgi:Zn-dependent peptidase ImmA (M78 family)/transcriptional regulator with XRE-family HTH domain